MVGGTCGSMGRRERHGEWAVVGTPGGLRGRARQVGGTPAVAGVAHGPHQVEDRDELVAHLAAQHGYSPGMVEDGSRCFLDTIHVRSHHRMAEEPLPTAEALAGTAERLSAGALETLEALRPLDRDLALQLAGRWAQALHAIAGDG